MTISNKEIIQYVTTLITSLALISGISLSKSVVGIVFVSLCIAPRKEIGKVERSTVHLLGGIFSLLVDFLKSCDKIRLASPHQIGEELPRMRVWGEV